MLLNGFEYSHLIQIIYLHLHDWLFCFPVYQPFSVHVRAKVGRVLANGPGDLGSIPGRVIPKTFKMVLDNSLLNNQQYKERIEGKVEQSRKRSSALPYTSV